MGHTYGNRPGAHIPAMEQRHFWFMADTLKAEHVAIRDEAETLAAHYADGLKTREETSAAYRLLNARIKTLHSLTKRFVEGCKASNGQFKADRFWEAAGFVMGANGPVPMWRYVEVAE